MNEDSNGLMRRFHTSARNEDIEDLYVDFNDKMDPMSFMQIVSSKDLYVIGHGDIGIRLFLWQRVQKRC